MTNRYQIATSTLLEGTRCYVDASTVLDQPNSQPRTAGLGVFITNFQAHPTQTIYIKARMVAWSSVLMAEAASFALAASIIHMLNINCCSFLSDCEQLVHFLNLADLTNPPDWRIKPFTQIFHNITRNRTSRIYKISRSQNTTADALARQAFSYQNSSLETSCSYELCLPQCSVIQALQLVDLNDVTVLAARYC
jgi:hypothetical protein